MMNSTDLYTVRPTRTNLPLLGSGCFPLEGAFRAHLSAGDMNSLSLKPGDYFWIRQANASSEGEIRSGIAVAWRSNDSDMNGNAHVVKLTDVARALYGIPPKSKVIILPLMTGVGTGQCDLPRAAKVILRAEDDHGRPLKALPPGHSWEVRAMGVLLEKHEIITKNTYFSITIRHGAHRGRKLNCVVVDVVGNEKDLSRVTSSLCGGPKTIYGHSVFEVDSTTAVTFSLPGSSLEKPISSLSGPESSSVPLSQDRRRPSTTFSQLAGLQSEIEAICDHLALGYPLHSDSPVRLSESRNLLIFGAAGTGKATVLSAISNHPTWKSVQTVKDLSGTSRSVSQLGKIFEDAVANIPSLILLPKIDGLGSRGEARNADAMTILLELADHIKQADDAAVTIVATAQIPNDIPAQLRNHFGREIELPIPSMASRREILQSMLGRACPDLSQFRESQEKLVEFVAERTHGYVGRDLKMLVNQAVDIARQRKRKGENAGLDTFPSSKSALPGSSFSPIVPTDFTLAIKHIRPSALKEVMIETPKVLWSDIGGCTEVKQKLHKATTQRLKAQSLLEYFTVPPTKGILMYGPPGCSKTLTAKAAATESGFNFIAIKGAELTNMYVGETERAIREVFRKARAAQPTIVFFDEIDSIASNRFSSSGKSNSHPGLSVVTTLLNEMDGIESLDGVLVLAATNRPDALDDALVRPGRFSELLYLGPPDEEARRQILKIRTRNTPLGHDVDLAVLAVRLEGYTGAEVVEVVNQACSEAVDEFIGLVSENDEGSVDATAGLREQFLGLTVSHSGFTGSGAHAGDSRSSLNSLPVPQLPESLSVKGGLELPKVYSRHFESALEVVLPAVRPGMLDQYKAWKKHRRNIF